MIDRLTPFLSSIFSRYTLTGFVILCWLASDNSALAGGPLVINGTNPVRWSTTKPVEYWVDQGDLGPLSNFMANQLISTAFSKWDREDSATINLKKAGNLPQDIVSSNVQPYIQTSSTIVAIIFDDDGSIFNDLFGGSAKRDYLGITAPIYRTSEYRAGYVMFNGYFFREHRQTNNEILATFIHEFGHILGLDHSQIHRTLANNGNELDDVYIPVMFPTTTDNDEKRTELTLDDRVALANLYPTSFHRNSTGAIEGSVTRGDTQKTGVNILAFDVTDSLNKVISTVSGTYRQRSGSYELRGLPPGQYRVLAEPVWAGYRGASSVGPYAGKGDGSTASFNDPIRTEYYNQDDNGTEGRSVNTEVKVEKLRDTQNINFKVESSEQPPEEKEVDLLAINATHAGGARPRQKRDYLLYPSGDEVRLDIRIQFAQAGAVDTLMGMETNPNQYDAKTFPVQGLEQTIVLGQGGDFPLLNRRYFIKTGSETSAAMAYTITVTQSDEPLPTPTPTTTPSQTPTVTPTETPTHTRTATHTPSMQIMPSSTPTPVETPSPTSTRKPTEIPTPSPVLPMMDFNQDGKVDKLDLFHYSALWRASDDTISSSPDAVASATETQLINDLLFLIEQLKLPKP